MNKPLPFHVHWEAKEDWPKGPDRQQLLYCSHSQSFCLCVRAICNWGRRQTAFLLLAGGSST